MTEEAQAKAINRQTNFSFLLKDFEKIFDMYIYSHSERSEATKMFVTVITVPFLLLSLFGIAGDIQLKNKSLIEILEQFPNFMFLVFSIFGIVGIVPYHRFIAAHSNTYKMIRYMNGYRLFYYQLIKEEIDRCRWRSAIEKDPTAPVPRVAKMHWASGFALAMFAVNTSYVCLGLWLWDGQASLMVMGLSALIVAAIHIALAREELRTTDVQKLKDLCVPIEDVLKSVEDEVK